MSPELKFQNLSPRAKIFPFPWKTDPKLLKELVNRKLLSKLLYLVVVNIDYSLSRKVAVNVPNRQTEQGELILNSFLSGCPFSLWNCWPNHCPLISFTNSEYICPIFSQTDHQLPYGIPFAKFGQIIDIARAHMEPRHFILTWVKVNFSYRTIFSFYSKIFHPERGIYLEQILERQGQGNMF